MVETGHFASLWKTMAVKIGLQPEFIASDWRTGADPAKIEARLARGQGARDQGRVRGAQRDLDRLRHADQRGAQGDRCGGASGAADGRHHLVARLDRLSPRRVGRRRHGRRLAEGPDAAAGAVVQRARREGARRREEFEAAEVVLGLGRDDRQQQDRLLPLHARDQHALRARRSDRHAARGGPGERVRAARPPRRGDAARGARVGPGNSLQGAAALFVVAHRAS